MLYIHKTNCISPQQSFLNPDLRELKLSADNMMKAIEPSYEGIPPGQLRRMGKAVRLGVGAALPLLKDQQVLDGIILGTANGGMEDCIKFLNQIIDYDEGTLTPTNFVQSTTNAIASQVAFMAKNKGYNITHVHRGLSFENALQDAMMLALEDAGKTYLLGGVDEISDYNFNIDYLIGCFKSEITSNTELYDTDSVGTIAGEAAAMFIVNGIKENAIAAVKAMAMLHSKEMSDLQLALKDFLSTNKINSNEIDLLITGENGDNRSDPFSIEVEKHFPQTISILRYKHATGEFPSASSFSLWLACHLLGTQEIPNHFFKRKAEARAIKNILLYNCYQGVQHSFVMVTNSKFS